MESGYVCGTNTAVSSTNSELGSHAHRDTVDDTVDGTLEEDNDRFVAAFLCPVKRCFVTL